MKKLFKFTLYFLITLLLLVVLATVLIGILVDTNKLKAGISELVSLGRGRTIVIHGDMKHSFFPWLGLEAHDVVITNAPGFSETEPFLQVGEADIQVKLLPLLRGEIKVGKIVLKELSLNLAKNAAGQTNWEDMLNKKNNEAKKAQAKKTKDKSFKSFSVAAIEVIDSNITWVDEKNNQKIKFTHVSMNSKGIASDKQFPFNIKFDVANFPAHLSGEYALDAKMTLDTRNNLYTLDNLKFNVTMPSGDAYKTQGSAKKVILDLPDQTLDVTDFKVACNNLEVDGDFHMEQVIDAPIYTGSLNAKSSNIKSFLKAIGKDIQTKDPGVLGNLTLSTHFRGTINSIKLDAFDLHLDDTISKGNANISSFRPLLVDFNQNIDQLDLDRYGAPSIPLTPAAPPASLGFTAQPIPQAPPTPPSTMNFASLRAVTIGGGLNIGLLTVGGVEFSQVHVQLLLQDGVLNISPFTAHLYGGKMQARVTANFQEDIPHYAIHKTLSNIDLSQLSKEDRFIGLANINTQLTTLGVAKQEMLENLNGAIEFNVEHGSLKGINVPFETERALALVKKQTPPAQPTQNETEFAVFSGTGMIQNGVFTNNDLLIESPRFKVTGQGNVSFVSEKINYHLRAVGMQTVKNAEGLDVQEERQTVIPLFVTGSFSKPIVTPDVAAIASMLLKQKMQEATDKNFQKSKEKAIELKEKIIETTGQSLLDVKGKTDKFIQHILQ
jgi:AsmA protein